jgi:hypothetical protein
MQNGSRTETKDETFSFFLPIANPKSAKERESVGVQYAATQLIPFVAQTIHSELLNR